MNTELIRLEDDSKSGMNRLVFICASAFVLAAIATATADIFDLPAFVAKLLSVSSEAAHPAVDALIVIGVGLYTTYLVFKLVRERTAMVEAMQFRAHLLDAANDAIFAYHPDGTLVYANETGCKFLGYTRDEMMLMNRFDFVAPDYADLHRQAVADSLAKNGSTIETAHLRKDGSTIPIEAHIRTVALGREIFILSVCRDITERKKMEEGLRFLASFPELNPQPIVETDEAGNITYLNPASRRLFPDLSTLGREHPILTDWAQILGELQNSGGTGAVMHDATVDTSYYERAFQQVRTSDDSQRIRVYCRDITSRKRVEQSLRESEERFRTLFNDAPVGIVLSTVPGRTIDVNKTLMKMHGYEDREELLGASISDRYYDINDRQRWLRIVQEQGAVEGYEVRLRRKDGTSFWASYNTLPHAGEAGDQQLITVVQDITKRKQAEEALLQSEERFRRLSEASFEGIVISDEGRIIDANATLAEMLKCKLSDLSGRSVLDFIAPEYRDLARQNVARQYEQYELVGLREDGSTFPVEARAKTASIGGRAVRITAVRDITERKKMQEQLMVNDRLAVLGQLVSGVAHELNNPLTGVIGFSELLFNRKDLPDDAKKDVDIINREAQRTANIVKNLLTFARKQPKDKQPTDINKVIESVLELRVYEQKVNNILVNTKFRDDLPEIIANTFDLQQVFLNIIVNAEQAMLEAHNRGTITIITARQDDNVRISFADDGPGIAPENMKRIFDPFFTTKDMGKGTGLGLSICHGIVTEHGGRIYAESEFGKGATFIVELPVKATS